MFIQGQDCTRDEIHHALGGSKQSYLPDVGGRVVSGRRSSGELLTPRITTETAGGRLIGYVSS